MECNKSCSIKKSHERGNEGYLLVMGGRRKKSEGWADVSIKVRWMSFFSAGCGMEMTKQLVIRMAGDPNYGTNKQG